MENIFDLREFLIMLYQKAKSYIVLVIAFTLIGATYGASTVDSNVYISQSACSINFIASDQNEIDGLDVIMGNIRETITSNYFYIGVLNDILSSYEQYERAELNDIFKVNQNPDLNDLKGILNIYTSGNNVIIEVKSNDSSKSQRLSNYVREIAANKLAQNIQNITITIQDQYVYNQQLETGDNSSTQIIKYAIAGGLAGIVCVMFYGFFFNVIDTRVRSAADLRKYNIPILGEITIPEGEHIDE